MTYEEIEEQFPEEFVRREKDKLAYRYPRGKTIETTDMRQETSDKGPETRDRSQHT